MPIYGYNAIEYPWMVCRELKRKELIELKKIFSIARRSCKYADNDSFRKSIVCNISSESITIAKFDIHDSNLTEAAYTDAMEDLIMEANRILSRYDPHEINRDKYRFDIIGGWTVGRVMIIQRKGKK